MERLKREEGELARAPAATRAAEQLDVDAARATLERAKATQADVEAGKELVEVQKQKATIEKQKQQWELVGIAKELQAPRRCDEASEAWQLSRNQ